MSTTAVKSSFCSALGYLFVTFYATLRFQDSEARSDALPLTVYYIYAGLILTGGILGAVVASLIRTHVTAALREAVSVSGAA